MSRFIFSLSLLALIAQGCDDNGSSTTTFYHQPPMQIRPIVSIVPVIDNTKNNYVWDLSDELSSALYSRLFQQDKFFVVESAQVREKIKKIKKEQNPFGTDFAWVKKTFQGDEFVVFLELVEHEEVVKQDRKRPSDPKDFPADLNMSMRVRVFDIRGNEPKVILQELIHDSHFIPRQFTHLNFDQVAWGDESFAISPVGLAHAEFTKEIASRLEDYILTASK